LHRLLVSRNVPDEGRAGMKVHSIVAGLLALSLLGCGRRPAQSVRGEPAERVASTTPGRSSPTVDSPASPTPEDEAVVLERMLAEPAPICCHSTQPRPRDKALPALADNRAQGLVLFEGDLVTPQEKDSRLAQHQAEIETERQRLENEASLRETDVRARQAEAEARLAEAENERQQLESDARVREAKARARQAEAEARLAEAENAAAAQPQAPAFPASPYGGFSERHVRSHHEQQPEPTAPAAPERPLVTPQPTPTPSATPSAPPARPMVLGLSPRPRR